VNEGQPYVYKELRHDMWSRGQASTITNMGFLIRKKQTVVPIAIQTYGVFPPNRTLCGARINASQHDSGGSGVKMTLFPLQVVRVSKAAGVAIDHGQFFVSSFEDVDGVINAKPYWGSLREESSLITDV
jgi:hypothetical protein